jgi:hypothetical protein
MLDFLGDVITGIFLGFIIILVFSTIFGGGGIVIKGTKKYERVNRAADARVKEILKNGSGSTKAELQEWWDTNHSKYEANPIVRLLMKWHLFIPVKTTATAVVAMIILFANAPAAIHLGLFSCALYSLLVLNNLWAIRQARKWG